MDVRASRIVVGLTGAWLVLCMAVAGSMAIFAVRAANEGDMLISLLCLIGVVIGGCTLVAPALQACDDAWLGLRRSKIRRDYFLQTLKEEGADAA